jgi:ferrous iron transport protein B
LFNIASGSHEHVGNYSGVTVDAKEGTFEYGGYHFQLVDLPGTYSLSAYSPEELFVREHLIKELPDVVVNVVDATNLERNLYLSSQLIDMDLRVVMALNMFDEFSQKKDKLDIKMLGTLLGMPIVPTVSKTGKGINELFDSIIDIYENIHTKRARHIHIHHGVEVEKSIEKVQHLIRQNEGIRQKYSTRYLAIKYLENDKEIAKEVELFENRDEIIAARYQEDKRIERLIGSNLESAIVDAKYAFIQGALKETYKPSSETPKKTLTDRIDSIITNKWLAFPIFILILYVMFEATFKLGEYPMMWIEWLVEKFALFISTTMPEGLFKDLIVDGIIGGVGSVLVFLPNILILYMFISLLEDSGYMARAAFIMDKLMHRMGLHGKSFIPMIMGFGCNVPAIMATRMIENRKSRLVTILIIPLMSCAGRLPIYILLAGAFFPSYGSLVMLGIYGLGILLAIFSAKVISRFMKEDDLPFVMELPPYRVPTSKSIFRHTWEKGKQYLQKMGGIILVASLIIWSLGYFPRQQEGQTTAQQQEQSYIGTIGKAIEPALEPLGFDWKMGVGILSGIAAKELVVSTMGVLYNIDQEQLDSGSGETMLQKALQQASTPAAALAFMVFVLLYFPCIATFIAIKQEGGGWKWAIFSAIYTIILAWVAAFAVYQIGSIFL